MAGKAKRKAKGKGKAAKRPVRRKAGTARVDRAVQPARSFDPRKFEAAVAQGDAQPAADSAVQSGADSGGESGDEQL